MREGRQLAAANEPRKKFRTTELLVRKKGLEPLRPFGHQLLRLARLPIPPLPQRTFRRVEGSVTNLRPILRASSLSCCLGQIAFDDDIVSGKHAVRLVACAA